MYGSHLNVHEFTRSSHVVSFNQIQTSKNSPSVQSRTRHHVESDQAPLYMHIRRSHCLHVLLGFLRSHTTLLHEVAYDHVSVEAHVTLGSKVAHDILRARSHTVSINCLFALQFPHAAPSCRRHQHIKCIKSQSAFDHALQHEVSP